MTDQLRMQNSPSKQSVNQKRRQFWRVHLDSWATSGLSQTEYCRQKSLKVNRFTYWKRKFNRDNRPIEFVQVSAEPVETTHLFHGNGTPSLRLTVGSRFAIEILDGFSSTTLEQVLLTLERV